MKSKTRRNEEIITINIERQWSLFATSFALSLIYSIVIISISDSDLPVILKNTLILFYLGVYLLPSIISYDLISYYQDDMDIPQVKHPNAFMITSINLLLGWTIIIWLILLYLSVKPGIVKVKKITFEPIDNFETREKITAVSKNLENLSKVFIVQHLDTKIDYKSLENAAPFNDHLNHDEKLQFSALPFDHPLFIMYSSGTTGKPKCIVHSAGGTLIQHMKEHQLHLDLKPNDRLFFFTTCGWMMWNWLVSALASKATIILYEGSPFYPHNEFLWAVAEEEKINHFGISPRYITTMMKENIKPLEKYNLKSLQTILSTGSPLLSDHFQYIQDAIKSDVQISSISGGTDIISCFALGNPIVPVFDGEIQSIGLGMAVKVFNDAGQEAAKEEKGELVCTQPFPSMPIGFFNDPDKKKYKQSYFNKFENTWAHGDFATITENNGVIIFGRSDTTLNSGGVRIGTAEIYRQTEKLPQILDAVVVETTKNSEPIVTLFVVLKKEEKLTNDLVKKIKYELKTNASPRHIPKHIIQVDDIPRTRSGKISELSVKAAIEGEEIRNIDALENPDSLSIYREFAKEN